MANKKRPGAKKRRRKTDVLRHLVRAIHKLTLAQQDTAARVSNLAARVIQVDTRCVDLRAAVERMDELVSTTFAPKDTRAEALAFQLQLTNAASKSDPNL